MQGILAVQVLAKEFQGEVTVVVDLTEQFDVTLQIEDAIYFAQRLDELGIDAIEVSSGTAGSGDGVPVRKRINSEDREAYNAGFAKQIKANVKVPVILVGGLRTFSVIEALLDEGAADMFSLARPLIREPELVNTWQTDPGHRSTCTSCNLCFRPGMREGGIYCVPEKKLQERKKESL